CFERNATAHFRDDRVSMRVPGSDDLTHFDVGLVGAIHYRTVRQLVAFLFTTVDVVDHQLTGAAHYYELAVAALHGLHVVQVNRTFGLDLYAVVGSGSRCGTTDVERTHGQLGTRLTDRLCGNNAH